MTTIYELHDKAFQHVRAYALVHKGQHVGLISFKYPNDGAGRLWCYVHLFGLTMARGYAGGYGYDKTSAAAFAAVQNIPTDSGQPLASKLAIALRKAVKGEGSDWKDDFKRAHVKTLRAL